MIYKYKGYVMKLLNNVLLSIATIGLIGSSCFATTPIIASKTVAGKTVGSQNIISQFVTDKNVIAKVALGESAVAGKIPTSIFKIPIAPCGHIIGKAKRTASRGTFINIFTVNGQTYIR
jgi:hypothetical protein